MGPKYETSRPSLDMVMHVMLAVTLAGFLGLAVMAPDLLTAAA